MPDTTFLLRLRPERFDTWQQCLERFNRHQRRVGLARVGFATEGVDDDGQMTLTVTAPDLLTAFALGVAWGAECA